MENICMNYNIKQLIKKVRKKIEDDLYEVKAMDIEQYFLNDLDDFLSSNNSDIEKAFYLLLNQYAGEKHYIVRPHQYVRVRNLAYYGPPMYKEYEIDFAIYAGSFTSPLKIAIECDGKRSHGEKFQKRDRKKDINLQCAGWIIIRIGSKELHEEIQNLADNNLSDLITDLEGLIETKVDFIGPNMHYHINKQLTGYNYGRIECPNCNKKFDGFLNAEYVKCHHCKKSFHPPEYNHLDYVD